MLVLFLYNRETFLMPGVGKKDVNIMLSDGSAVDTANNQSDDSKVSNVMCLTVLHACTYCCTSIVQCWQQSVNGKLLYCANDQRCVYIA
jgi:hypothetical protein